MEEKNTNVVEKTEKSKSKKTKIALITIISLGVVAIITGICLFVIPLAQTDKYELAINDKNVIDSYLGDKAIDTYATKTDDGELLDTAEKNDVFYTFSKEKQEVLAASNSSYKKFMFYFKFNFKMKDITNADYANNHIYSGTFDIFYGENKITTGATLSKGTYLKKNIYTGDNFKDLTFVMTSPAGRYANLTDQTNKQNLIPVGFDITDNYVMTFGIK